MVRSSKGLHLFQVHPHWVSRNIKIISYMLSKLRVITTIRSVKLLQLMKIAHLTCWSIKSLFGWLIASVFISLARDAFSDLNYNVLQKYTRIRLNQNLFRSTTLDIITRLLDNAAFICVHVVGRFSKDFSEVRGLRGRRFQV